MKKTLLFLLVWIVGLQSPYLWATHTMGADITYRCLSPNRYQVKLTFFRDCAGILPASTQQLNYRSLSCGVAASINLSQLGAAVDVTPLCPTQLSACQGGTNNFGIEQYTFVGTLNLPSGCSDWELSWDNCCRNFAITTLSAPGNQSTYVTARLDNTTTPCNNSPVFNNIPTPIVCVNQPVNYNHGVTDPDGDSLVFSLSSCYEDPGDPVNYAPGYSSTVPLSTAGGVNIDPQTGAINFVPNQQQIGVLCVRVEEYRGGVKIGETIRDMQFSVINCTNAPPIATGVNGDTVEYSANFCVGSSLCFDVLMSDPDGNHVWGSWNQGIPGGSFLISNNGSTDPVGTFCWQPTAADIGSHFFTVTVADDHCPLTGAATYAFTVNVGTTGGTVNASPDQTICQGGSVNLLASASPLPDSIRWTPALGLNNPNIFTPVASPQVTTTYTVQAYLPGGCVAQEDVVVNVSDGPAVSVSPPSALTCAGGTVTLTAIAPTATSYLWSTGATTASIDVNPAATTTYQVTVTDATGCSRTVSATVTVAAPGSEQCNVIYVAPGATGLGTQADPASLADALSLASCTPMVVKLDAGLYVLDQAITTLPDNITLEGGFQSAAGWRKSSAPGLSTLHRSALNPAGPPDAPRLVAFEINGANNFRLQDLTITTADGLLPGTSTYGLHLSNCANYDLVRCQILPGAAAAGADGAAGVDGADGGNGLAGGDGDEDNQFTPGDGGNGGSGGGTNGGAGGVGGQDNPAICCLEGLDGANGATSTDARSGGGGGGGASGGEGNNDGGMGGRGGGVGGGLLQAYCPSPNHSAGGIGMGFSPTTAQDGHDGCDGEDGTDGVNGTLGPVGGHTLGFWQPGGPGTMGTAGTGGKGGNGGGAGGGQGCGLCINGAGNGGGGGGGGAEGGAGGEGGRGGGSSYAVYLYNNGAGGEVSSCWLSGGAAGAGGIGGPGGSGGLGGSGALGGKMDILDIGEGGDGGNGGNGGNGGKGGDGAPGESHAVYQNGGIALALTAADTAFDLTAQPIIGMDNVSCVNANCQFTGGNGFWDLGPNSDPIMPGIHTDPITTFQATGREDIVFNGSVYEGFAFIQVGSNPIPEAATSAPMVDGYYRLCVGSNTNFTAVNGVPGYVYRWDLDTAAATWVYEDLAYQNLSNIAFATADTFDILLQYYTDCCGYTVADTLPLIVEPEPSLALTAPTDLCLGQGPAILQASGGDSYTWTPSTGLSFFSPDSVLAQPAQTTTYQVTAYSASGLCYDQQSYTLNVTDLLLNGSSTDAGCLPDGTASVSVSNGSGVYNYQWSHGPTTPTVTGLAPGAYQVRVSDPIRGCVDSAVVVVGDSPGSLQAYVSSSNPASCSGVPDGSATVAVSGGTGPLSYAWSTGASTPTLSGAAAGSYSVDVTDGAGCTTTLQVNITEPVAISAAMQTQTLPDCNTEGSLTVEADGSNGPFTFAWNTTPAQTGPTASNLNPGNYTVTITDQQGCSETLTLSLPGTGAPVDLTLLNAQDATTCSDQDGSITVTAGDSVNTTFTWLVSPVQTGPTLSGIGPGTYPVQATRGTCQETIFPEIGPVCPLLLSQLSLQAEAQARGVFLTWNGLLRDTLAPIFLEKRQPDQTFQALQQVRWQDFSFLDSSVRGQNRYQYRLRQQQSDGRILYSEIAEVQWKSARMGDWLEVYPNPTADKAWAELYLAEEGSWRMELLNPVGQVIWEKTLILTADLNKLRIDTENLPNGIYLLRFTSLSGTTFEKKYEQRLVKTH